MVYRILIEYNIIGLLALPSPRPSSETLTAARKPLPPQEQSTSARIQRRISLHSAEIPKTHSTSLAESLTKSLLRSNKNS